MGLLTVPLLGLSLLLARPELDIRWEHHPAHFWLVVIVAFINVALAIVMGEAARRRGGAQDARLFLISLAFLASAGFLGLHALATPGVLLPTPNTGFVIAIPIGIFLSSCFALASTRAFSPESSAAVMRRQRPLLWGVLAVFAAWAFLSLSGIPPLSEPPARAPSAAAAGLLVAIEIGGVVLLAISTARYLEIYRRRPAPFLLAVIGAFVLLAEAMIAAAFGRNWHATWWEWHVLLLGAFGLVARTGWSEYHRSGSVTEVFGGLYLEHTLARIDARYVQALKHVTAAMRQPDGFAGNERMAVELHQQFGLSSEEARALGEAASWMRQLDTYLSPDVVAKLEESPGDEEREISVLFADLQGFTTFSERASPQAVLEMLNNHFTVAVRVLRDNGATVDKFIGDAIMAEFNAFRAQPDHALKAARAGLEMQRETDEIASTRPGWPRFRVGINTGQAMVGMVGGQEQRSFTVIGDTVNLASRLEGVAQVGQVVIGAETYRQLPEGAVVQPLGGVQVKGKEAAVEAYVLIALPGEST